MVQITQLVPTFGIFPDARESASIYSLPQDPICTALPHPGATAPASARLAATPATGRSAPFYIRLHPPAKAIPRFTPAP